MQQRSSRKSTLPKPTEEDMRFYMEHIDGLMVIDVAGRVTYMNRQCADYIKIDLESSIGKHVSEVFPGSSMEELLNSDRDTDADFYFADGGFCFSRRQKMKDKNGQTVGVIEYDLIQNIDSLEGFIAKYTHILTDEMQRHAEMFRSLRRTKYTINELIGSSDVMRELKNKIMRAAISNSTVIVSGETGTGKELVAHSIHNMGNRTFGSFIKVNAAGLPDALVESELFGYEEGAFTGAKKGGKKGKFELANGGTLFIDEINQMPLAIQPKLLRALQEREIDRVGGECSIPVDVRIIAATNKQLKKLVDEGAFREDLYYRLNVLPIETPPLREHREDIPELVMDKVVQLNLEQGKNVVQIDDEVYTYLQKFDWPGNVRELHNAVEKAMNYTEAGTLGVACFLAGETDIDEVEPEAHKGTVNWGDSAHPIETVRKEAESRIIKEALLLCDGNRSKAAKKLKISRPLLYQKMHRLGIEDNR